MFVSSGGANTYLITPKHSRTKVLDAWGEQYGYGYRVHLWQYNNGATQQQWVLERANYELMSQLHQAAKNQDSSATGSYRKMFNYMRTPFYSGTMWNETAGPLDSSFKSYADSYNAVFPHLRNYRQVILDPWYGEVDFTHMAATGNALVYDSSIILGLTIGNEDADALAGWAGDLQSIISQAINNPNIYSGQTFYNRIYNMVGNESYYFGLSDLMADIDAMYFVQNASTTNFGTTLKNYYADDGPHKNRKTYFNGKVSASKVDYYTKQNRGAVIGWQGKWPIYAGLVMSFNPVAVDNSQAYDATDAFRDKLSSYWN